MSTDATTGVLTVTGDASTATYQTIMRGVVYQYTGDAPSTGDRTVTVVVNDGLDNSITHTATVHVLPMNDAPSLAGPLAATVTEGGIHTLTAAELGYTDPDNTASEVVFHVSSVQHGTITNGGAPATSFTAAELAAGLIKFTHDGSEDSPTTFQVYVRRRQPGRLDAGPGTFTFTVDGVNDAPVITSAPAADACRHLCRWFPRPRGDGDHCREPRDSRSIRISTRRSVRCWRQRRPTCMRFWWACRLRWAMPPASPMPSLQCGTMSTITTATTTRPSMRPVFASGSNMPNTFRTGGAAAKWRGREVRS